MKQQNNMNSQLSNNTFHSLSDKWTLYAHLPHDTDWTIDSYKKIIHLNFLEEVISLFEALPDKLVKNCMLFLMKNNIKPVWEDEQNRNGGCFSYKVNNEDVSQVWKELSYLLIGNTLTENNELKQQINGITISPKKKFCIIKIWLSEKKFTKTCDLKEIHGLNHKSALFKAHNPEY